MTKATKIALWVGGGLLVLSGGAGGAVAASQGSLQGNAAASDNSLLGQLKKLVSALTQPKKQNQQKPGIGLGGNPAGGLGSGRSAGGVTPILSLEDSMFGLGLLTPDQIDQPTTVDIPDPNLAAVSNSFDSSSTGVNDIIGSLAPTGADAIPQLDPSADPNAGIDTSGIDPTIFDSSDPSFDPFAGGL